MPEAPTKPTDSGPSEGKQILLAGAVIAAIFGLFVLADIFIFPRLNQKIEKQTSKAATQASTSQAPVSNKFINKIFAYSVKIPGGWKEYYSLDQQKRWRFYSPANGAGHTDEDGFYNSEIQILTLAYTDPAFSGDTKDFEKLLALKPGQSLTVDEISLKKVKNVILDGKSAFYTSFVSSSYIYSVTAFGKARYVSILMVAADQSALLEHQKDFESFVGSFEFNSFTLD